MRKALLDHAALVAIGLRGLRSRLLLTVGSVVLVAIAIAGAVVGPMYQSASANSFLVSQLRAAPAVVSGLSLDYRGAQPSAGLQATEAIRAAGRFGLAHFAPPEVTIRTADRSVPSWATGGSAPQATLVSGTHLCDVMVVTGRCPARAGEMLMLRADASFTGTQPGERVAVPGLPRPLTLVGTYQLPTASDAVFDPSQYATVPAHSTIDGEVPYHPAPLIVSPTTIDFIPAGGRYVRMDLLLLVPVDTTLQDLRAAVREVQGLTAGVAQGGGRSALTVQPGNELPSVVGEAEARQATGKQTVAPAVVSLILVAWVLLARLLSAATDLRQSELALAALRGLGRQQVWVLGMLEPALIIALSTPIGLAVGYLAAARFAATWLVPGLPLPLGQAAVWSVAGVVLATVLVAALVVRAATARPLDAQLTRVRRPSLPGRWVAAGRLALVAAAAAVLFVTAGSGRQSQPSVADILLPMLLAAAGGLLVGQLTWRLSAWWVRRTPRRRSMVQFLAFRTVARRQESSAVILPFTAALAIAVFAVGIYATAANWRASDAATQVGADTAYPVSIPLPQAVELTHQLDPQGRWLMAVGATSIAGATVIVDAPRLARVAAWPASWTPGRSVEDIARALAPARPTLVVTGRRVQATITNEVRLSSSAEILLGIDVVTPAGEARHIYLGGFPPGRSTQSTTIGFCRGRCQVTRLTISGPATLPEPMQGSLLLSDLRVDGAPLAYFTGIGWRADVDTEQYGAASVVESSAAGGQLRVRLDSHQRDSIAALAPGDVPAVVPVVAGRDSDVPRPDGNLRAPDAESPSRDLPVRAMATSESAPLLGPSATVVDYTAYSRTQQIIDPQTTVSILARSDTPASVVAGLASNGISQPISLRQVRDTLDQDAYALSLNLYLVVSAVVVLLALVGLAVNIAVQLPVRRGDAASLRVVGVRRKAIVASAAAEHAIVLGAAAGAGILVGSLSQYVVTRSLTLGYSTGVSTPRVRPALDLSATTLLLVAAWGALLAVAILLGALTIRASRTSTLRESA